MIGYVYLITDVKNGKQYVGQHHYDKEELDPNYHGSGHIIKQIYNKRPETLKEEYLKTCYSQRELDEYEKYFIFTNNTMYPNGYNLQEGGRGGTPSEETRMRISEANKGKRLSERTRMKMSKAHKGLCTGKKHPNYGKKASDETRQKLSKSHKGLLVGEKHPMFGKHHKDESRKKISKTVLQYTLDGKFVREWISTHEAERTLNISQGNISQCCRGNRRLKSAGGFIWRYKDMTYNEDINYKTAAQQAIERCSKTVLQYTLDGKFVREWPSTKECGRNGFKQGAVAACCRGDKKYKQHHGFIWRYK